MDEMIRTLPMIPLRGLTVLPLMIVNFDISRKKSIRAVEAAMEQEQTIFLVTQRDPEEDQPGIDGLYHTGTVAKIKNIAKLPKNIVRVMVEGVGRGHLLAMQEGAGYLLGQAEISEEEKPQFDELTKTAMVRALQDLLGRYGQINQKFGKDMMQQLMAISDVEALVAEAGAHLPLFYEERQRILDAENFSDRYDALCTVIANEAEIIQIRNELQQKVKERVDKNQKEYILREQLKVIQQELGEDTLLTDVENYKKQAEALTASDEVKKKIIKEAEHLKSLGGNSAESSVLRGYIETLLELPWDKVSKDNQDLKNAARVLDEDHYGLEKVKERVLEFLAVRTLTNGGDSPILCLAGPPGTG